MRSFRVALRCLGVPVLWGGGGVKGSCWGHVSEIWGSHSVVWGCWEPWGSSLWFGGSPAHGLGVLGPLGSVPVVWGTPEFTSPWCGGPYPTIWGLWVPWVLSPWLWGPHPTVWGFCPHGLGAPCVPSPWFWGSPSHSFGVLGPWGSVPTVWGTPESPPHDLGVPIPHF